MAGLVADNLLRNLQRPQLLAFLRAKTPNPDWRCVPLVHRQSRGGEVSTVLFLPMLRRRFFAEYIKSAPNSPFMPTAGGRQSYVVTARRRERADTLRGAADVSQLITGRSISLLRWRPRLRIDGHQWAGGISNASSALGV